MNKRMREILATIENKRNIAKSYMDGEMKDIEKAGAILNEVDELQKEYDIEKRLFEAEKEEQQEEVIEKTKEKKASGFVAISKMLNKKRLGEKEKAMIVDGSNNENYLIPEDVRLAINEYRKQYKEMKNLVTVLPTDTLTGSFNWEAGEPAGLSDFEDGNDIANAEGPSFERKKYAIKFFGKLIPVSRILIGAEKAGLMGYLNRWFIKNAIITENKKIFEKLKEGKDIKQITGWESLKHSLNVDLDPDALYDAVIVTNQNGWDVLDSEVDAMGRPILQPDPSNPTRKLFQGLTVHVFSNSMLPDVDGKAPILYGSLKGGCSFVDYQKLEFATSEHIFFGKNQNALRVIEGFDVIQTDANCYIYGTIAPSESLIATASTRKAK